MKELRLIRELKSFHPIVNVLFIGQLFARIATSMSMPFLAIYLYYIKVDPLWIGLIVGASPLAGTLAGFVGGLLSDKFGRRKIMLLALYLWVAVFIGLSLVHSPILFFILNALNGISRAFFEPVSQALMGDLTAPELRFKVFSMRYVCINIGVAIGPMLGAFFGITAGATPFIITGVFYFIYAVILKHLLNHYGIRQIETKQAQTTIQPSFKSVVRVLSKDRILILFLIGGLLVNLSYSQMTPLSQYLTDHFEKGVKLYAVLMTVNAIVVVVTQYFISNIAEKFPPFHSIAAGNLLFALGGLGFAFSPNWTLMILSMVIFTLGEVLSFPMGSILIDQIAPPDLRGSYYGSQNLKNLGSFLGPTLGFYLLSVSNVKVLYSIITVVLIVSTVFYWYSTSMLNNRNLEIVKEGTEC